MTKAMREDYYANPIEFKKVCTPFCAIELDDYEMFVNLLTVDFNVNLTNERGETILMKAIEKENVPMVRCLINNGVDIYQMDYNYDMAIDYAKLIKNQDILKIILCRINYEEMMFQKRQKC